jgi:hypothetical protein
MSHIRTHGRGIRNSDKMPQRKAEAETGGKAYRGLIIALTAPAYRQAEGPDDLKKRCMEIFCKT